MTRQPPPTDLGHHTWRTLAWTRCPTCHEWVLQGLDADQAGQCQRYTPTPLDPLGEALAWLTGHTTARIIRSNNPNTAPYAHRRTAHDIRTHPAGTHYHHRPFDVLSTHTCHTIHTHTLTPRTLTRPTANTSPDTSTPPPY